MTLLYLQVSHLVTHPLSVLVHHPVLQPKTPNPCAKANCDQLCVLSPSDSRGYSCKCKASYLQDGDRCALDENPYLVVMKKSQVVDIPLVESNKTSLGVLTPVVGVLHGIQLEFDLQKAHLYWVEVDSTDTENVRIINRVN